MLAFSTIQGQKSGIENVMYARQKLCILLFLRRLTNLKFSLEESVDIALNGSGILASKAGFHVFDLRLRAHLILISTIVRQCSSFPLLCSL